MPAEEPPDSGAERRRPHLWRAGPEWNPAKAREKTRGLLALGLTLLLFLIALLLVVCTAADWLTSTEAKDLAASVLSPVVAVTGTALGFYFGAHRQSGE